MEGARMRSTVALPREVAKPTVIDDNGKKVNLKAGERIICNLVCEILTASKPEQLTHIESSGLRLHGSCRLP